MKVVLSNNLTEITSLLFEYQDLEYKEFHSKLMPTIDKDSIKFNSYTFKFNLLH